MDDGERKGGIQKSSGGSPTPFHRKLLMRGIKLPGWGDKVILRGRRFVLSRTKLPAWWDRVILWGIKVMRWGI